METSISIKCSQKGRSSLEPFEISLASHFVPRQVCTLKSPPHEIMSPNKASEITTVASPEPDIISKHDFKTAKRRGEKSTDNDGLDSADDFDREAALTALTAEEERKLIRRVDWRLVPLLCMLYFMKKIDEMNVRAFSIELLE